MNMIKKNSAEALGTVERVVEVLRFFAENGDSTLKDLSTAIKLAPSTCHRLVDLLGRQGLIEQDTAGRRYRIGRELFRLSALVQSRHDVRSISLPFLRKLVDACDETCVLSLYLPVEGRIFFAEKIDSSMMLRYQLPMNTPMSALWGATGRSIVAYLPKDEVDRIYESEGRAPASGEPLPSRRTLDQQFASIRERGFDISYGQKIEGAVGIGAPVFGIDGAVIGSVGLTVPATRITAKDHARLGKLVRGTAQNLSVALGSPLHKARASA